MPGGPPPQQRPGGFAPPPYAQPGGRPPYPPQAPGGRKLKRSPVPLIIGLVVLMVFVVGSLVAFVGALSATGGGAGGGFSFGDKIAVLDVEGPIGEGPAYFADSKTLKNQVLRWAENDSVKGLVVRLNTPGGAVAPTEEVYDAIVEFGKTGKPVYASMGSVAASGGYYLAMAADPGQVHTNGGTITGSVGVILNLMGYQALMDKIGLESRVIKSGEFKDIGNGARDLTEAERELLDTMVDDVYEQFLEVVMEDRYQAVHDLLTKAAGPGGDPVEEADVEAYLRTYCDGRIFSGRQAVELGMADSVSTFDEALDAMRKQLGMDKNSPIVRAPVRPQGLFGSIKQQVNTMQQELPGGAPLGLEYRMVLVK